MTDSIDTLADRQRDLSRRLAQALLRFELIGLDPDEQDQLEAEAREFLRLRRALAWLAKFDEQKAEASCGDHRASPASRGQTG